MKQYTDRLFVKPYKLLTDIAFFSSNLLGKLLHKKWHTVQIYKPIIEADSITIRMRVSVMIESDFLYETTRDNFVCKVTTATLPMFKLLLDENFNLNKVYVGSYGIYHLFDPIISEVVISVSRHLTDDNERKASVALNITFKYEIIEKLQIKKFSQEDARSYLKQTVPVLYAILSDPKFITGVNWPNVAEEINLTQGDVMFPYNNSNSNYLQDISENLSDLIIKAYFYLNYPYLYSKIKNLNIVWSKFNVKFDQLVSGIMGGMNRMVNWFEFVKFVTDGHTNQVMFNVIYQMFIDSNINKHVFAEIMHVFLETRTYDITETQREEILKYLRESDLYKDKDLYLP